MSDPDDEMRRLKVTDSLFDQINPEIAAKIIDGIRQKDSLALMFLELRVMQAEIGSKLDTLAEGTEERRTLGLRYSAIALAIRLLAKHIADGGEGALVDLYRPPA